MQKEILQRAKILLVDDEIENCGGLSRLLSDGGCGDLEHADPSSAGVRLDSQFQPDLIILDLPMPDDKGWQTLEQLRNSVRKETYLPILVVTDPTSIKVRPEALEKGATAFRTKPYDSAEAVLLVRSLLETRFLHLELSREVSKLKTRIEELTEINSGLQAEVAKRENVAAELREDPALGNVGHDAADNGDFAVRISVSFPFVSAGCRELFELGPEEIESDAQLFGNLLHHADRELFTRSMDESAANLQPWEWQGRFRLRSGEEKWVQGAARPEGGSQFRLRSSRSAIADWNLSRRDSGQ
jgi:CheY-like chemotaxis protein